MKLNYKQIDSFESDSPTAVGVGDQLIVMGIKDTIEVFRQGSRSSIQHTETIIDIAVGNNIFVLSSSSLTAYTVDGEQLWSANNYNGVSLGATSDSSVCGLLAEDSLKIIDASTGELVQENIRENPGGSDDQILSTDSSFIFETWSFLSSVTHSGEKQFDVEMEAVIKNIGYLNDVIVVALKNDRIIGIDENDGTIKWETEFQSPILSPYGDDQLIISSKRGVHIINSEGKSESLSNLPNGDVYITSKGGYLNVVNNGFISTYIRDDNRIDIELDNQSVGIGGAIELDIYNPTKSTKSVEIQLSIDNCTLDFDQRTVSIDSDENMQTEFSVNNVEEEGESNILVFANESLVFQDSIRLIDSMGGLQSVEADLSIDKVSNGQALLEIHVENKGSIPVESAEIIETGLQQENLGPGESFSERVKREYHPGRSVSVGYRVYRGNRQSEFASSCDLPPEPAITVKTEEEALIANISCSEDTIFDDQLVVELPGAKRVRTNITIENGSLQLIVPKYEDGVARIALDSINIEETIQISNDNSLITPSKSSKRSRNKESETDQNKSNNLNIKSTNAESSSTKNRAQSNNTHNSTINQNTDSTIEYESDKKSSGINIKRDISDNIPALGHTLLDEIKIINKTNSSRDLKIVTPEGDYDVNEIEPSGKAYYERFISILDHTSNTLPEIKLEEDNKIVASSSSETISINQDSLSVLSVFDVNKNILFAKIKNNENFEYKLNKISVGSKSNSQSLNKTVPSQSNIRIETDPYPKLNNIGENLPIWLEIESENKSEDVISILSYTTESTEIPDGIESDQNILKESIGGDTQVAGEFSSVVVEFYNSSTNILNDIQIAAKGDPINDTFYTEAYREKLNPEQEIHHYIDIETDKKEPSFDINVSFSADGENYNYVIKATGPALENKNEWEENHLNDWKLKRKDIKKFELPELPNFISTQFHESR